MNQGRKASIPSSVSPDIREWHRKGYGYRRICKLLAQRGVVTTKSGIHRAMRGKGAYFTRGIG